MLPLRAYCGVDAEHPRADGGAAALASSAEAVNKVLAKAAGVSTSSAAGKTLGGTNALRGTAQFHVYDKGTVVMAEMIIRYTQRARLVRPCVAALCVALPALILTLCCVVFVVSGRDGPA